MAIRSPAVVFAATCAASVACADTTVTFRTQLWGVYGSGFNGGPFQFEVPADSDLQPSGLGRYMSGAIGNPSRSFATFCLEYTEEINFGATYRASIETYAVAGGVSSTPGGGAAGYQPPASGLGDDLDYRTAYLYDRFMRGTLDELDVVNGAFDYGNASDGIALQKAIWFIEGERSMSEIGGSTSLAYKLVLNANAAVANQSIWGTTLGNIRVMNLYDRNSGLNKQSQLIMIPLPAGSGLATAGLACMFGAGWIRRRRR
jgi:hypothetical protein